MNNQRHMFTQTQRKRKHYELENSVDRFPAKKVRVLEGRIKQEVLMSQPSSKTHNINVIRPTSSKKGNKSVTKYNKTPKSQSRRNIQSAQPKICKKFLKTLEDNKNVNKFANITNYSQHLRKAVLDANTK
jgi:hypothetical protein